MKPRKPIRRVGKARAKQRREYEQVKEVYLSANPYCFMCLDFLPGDDRVLHHFYKRRGKLLAWVPGFRTVCDSCHGLIHFDETYSRGHGWLAPKECCDDLRRAQEHYAATHTNT